MPSATERDAPDKLGVIYFLCFSSLYVSLIYPCIMSSVVNLFDGYCFYVLFFFLLLCLVY